MDDEPIPIEQAARRVGMAPSALRYYDERGLVTPVSRTGGRRWYGREELRRLAFIGIARRLGLPLSAVAAVFDEPRPVWQQVAQEQIAELDAVIERARVAQEFLRRAVDCPTDNPPRECPSMIGALDSLVDGATIDDLARREAAADDLPPTRGRSPS